MSNQIPGLVIERLYAQPHRCDLPGMGYRARRQHGLDTGAIVRCTTCDQRWIWKDCSTWAGGGFEWVRLDD